ncbi:periplasmic heavy metal sensor [Spirosoma aerophilum]
MERTKLLTLATIGLLLLNLLTIGYLVFKPGQLGPPDHPPGRPGAEEPATVIIRRLHFDENQQARYMALVHQHQADVRVLRDQSTQLFWDFYGLLKADRPNLTQINDLSHQIGINQQQLAQLNLAHFGQIKALCRPDQKADFTELVADLSKLFGQQQRPPRPNGGGPPEGLPGNLPPRP